MSQGTLCVIQARTGSSRLPGKVLADLGGVPMLAFMLRRLTSLRNIEIVVATTISASDDAVAEVAASEGVAIVRGPEHDVLARFVAALDAHPADVVVRLTADCPLMDPAVVSAALELRDRTSADYASNTLVRTFPDGLDVEVLTADALRVAGREATGADEREHVTPFVYRRPERFALINLWSDRLVGDLRWTVDTADDLAFVRSVVARMDSTRFSWQDVLPLVPGPDRERVRVIPEPASEPARRQWVVVDGETVLARPVLAVRNGHGTLSLGLDPVAQGRDDDVLRLVRTELEKDLQVTQIEVVSG